MVVHLRALTLESGWRTSSLPVLPLRRSARLFVILGDVCPSPHCREWISVSISESAFVKDQISPIGDHPSLTHQGSRRDP